MIRLVAKWITLAGLPIRPPLPRWTETPRLWPRPFAFSSKLHSCKQITALHQENSRARLPMGCTRVPSGLLGAPSWRCAPVVKSATTPFIGWRRSLIGSNSAPRSALAATSLSTNRPSVRPPPAISKDCAPLSPGCRAFDRQGRQTDLRLQPIVGSWPCRLATTGPARSRHQRGGACGCCGRRPAARCGRELTSRER